MEITGKIIAVLPERSGVSARTGTEWRCASYVLETLEQYPRKMNFEVFGVDRIQQFNMQVGETMVVSFDIDAHEYQGRWFNSIRAWKVDRNVNAAPAPVGMDAAGIPPFDPAPQPSAAPQPAANPNADLLAGAPFASDNSTTDLPF